MAGCRFQLREGLIGYGRAARLIGQALLEAVRADAHITWSWRDPMPTLLELARPLTHRPSTRAEHDASQPFVKLSQLDDQQATSGSPPEGTQS